MKTSRTPSSRRHVLSAALLACSLATLPTLSHAAKLVDMAQALVEKYKLGHSLPQVALTIVAKSPDYQALVDKIGAPKAQQQLIAAAKQVAPEFQKRWDEQLANAYAQTFSEPQLSSLLELGPKSPHAQLMQSKQADVNKLMQKSSSGLLREMLGRVYTVAQNPVPAAAPAAQPAAKAKSKQL